MMAEVEDDLPSQPQEEASSSQDENFAIPEEEDNLELTAAQRARIERNRQRALLLRQSRLQSHPYACDSLGNRVKGPKKEIDTGAGFFIEEDEKTQPDKIEIVHPEAPLLEVDNMVCDGCSKEFIDSYFYTKFDELICDTCRLEDDKYPLITKTNARKRYILKDPDLDRREPPLKFILKKNPHNDRWGDMKLYLECQVKRRAMEVWGSEENMEKHREEQETSKERLKQKRFDKKVKELRHAVRSSLLRKEKVAHEHEFGVEHYDEEEDVYSKTCRTCNFTQTYEKM